MWLSVSMPWPLQLGRLLPVYTNVMVKCPILYVIGDTLPGYGFVVWQIPCQLASNRLSQSHLYHHYIRTSAWITHAISVILWNRNTCTLVSKALLVRPHSRTCHNTNWTIHSVTWIGWGKCIYGVFGWGYPTSETVNIWIQKKRKCSLQIDAENFTHFIWNISISDEHTDALN